MDATLSPTTTYNNIYACMQGWSSLICFRNDKNDGFPLKALKYLRKKHICTYTDRFNCVKQTI